MVLSVSAITPAYNQGAYIERTVRSVLTQDVPGLEYVIVDGGSLDGTLDVLRRYAGRLRWVSEPDRGPAHAVNKGLGATTGAVVGWLNSDDVWEAGAVRAACDFLDAHPEVDVVYGDARYVDADDRPVEPYHTEPWDLGRFLDACYIAQPAAFFRRRVVDRHGGLDERLRYCLDYEYWLRLALGGARFAYLPRLLAGYRLHPATVTVGLRLALHREVNDMLREKLGRVPDQWLFNYAHELAYARGFSRDRRVRFATALAVGAVYASARWNHRISSGVLTFAVRRVGGNARLALRQWAAGKVPSPPARGVG